MWVYHCLNTDEAQIRLLDMTLAFEQRWDWCRLLPWVPQTVLSIKPIHGTRRVGKAVAKLLLSEHGLLLRFWSRVICIRVS